MTKQEYKEYQEAVAEFFKREGLCTLTTISQEEGLTEPYFSWSPCDCCGSPFGGNRYDCNGYNEITGEIQDGYKICEDCVYYVEYGRLDDKTMMEIDG